MSQVHATQLSRRGVFRQRLRVEIPGVDPSLFRSHERTGRGAILVCSAYYPRKSGATWIAVARMLPEREVLVLGPGWADSPFRNEIHRTPNVRLLDLPYEDYPGVYDRTEVFLSTSSLEGGPMPLLEAMLSNVVPVCSATGFAPDVVVDGETGFILKVGSAPEHIAMRVEQAYSIGTNVRASVEHLTPQRYASAIWSEVEAHAERRRRR